MLTHFKLYPLLYPSAKFYWLENKVGQMNYMGQILYQLGLPRLTKDEKQARTLYGVELPHIPPFNIYCAGTLIQTDLTTNIINTTPENPERVVRLLKEFKLTAEILKGMP